MSTEEQQAAIGRLVMERSEAKRVSALLGQEIGQIKEKLNFLASSLGRTDTQSYLSKSLELTNILISAGGLDALHQKVSEYKLLAQRIEEIDLTLRNAGVFN